MEVNANRLKVSGTLLRKASIEDEEIVKVDSPLEYLSFLRKRRPKADIFTFTQRIPDTEPKYLDLFTEWDNEAAIPISSYDHWWSKQVNFKLRNKVRKLEKKGGAVRIVEFDDAFIRQIMGIYNESPVRQGRKFWHYQEPFDVVKRLNGTYPERNVFLGAYYENQLIGFIRLIVDPVVARIIQIISMIKHRDKAPTNALLAKAVEICAQQNISYLVYAKYVYGKKGIDTLSEFKQHNGFVKIDIPRYYIPLTLRGKLALKLGLHNGLRQLLPQRLTVFLLNIRAKWYAWRFPNC